MQVFGPVLYMDVQKTGSTFVTRFLADNLRYAHEQTRKHSRLQRARGPEEIVLLSSREPVSTWLSLYNYGCTGVGRLRRRLDRRGVGERFYSGDPEDFDAWVTYLQSPDAVDDLGEDYASLARLGVGFATFRELALSFERPLRRFAQWRDLDDLREAYQRDQCINVRLRHRRLHDDLIEACRGPLRKHLRGDADPVDYLDHAERINSSPPRVRIDDISDSTRDRILSGESLWFWLDEQWPE